MSDEYSRSVGQTSSCPRYEPKESFRVGLCTRLCGHCHSRRIISGEIATPATHPPVSGFVASLAQTPVRSRNVSIDCGSFLSCRSRQHTMQSLSDVTTPLILQL